MLDRRRSGQQLVEQHAQGIDVAAYRRRAWFTSACSGDMYSSVPIKLPKPVNIVCSVSRWPVALATPKSITFGTGLPSYSAIRTLEGLRSR